ncbi:MAG: threonine-phosphate decarboxylase CobD [Peptococcaceae bacterium]|nr:threonine-phosphate decarboxylase CobD [Peptococcaceae bacterium]
MAIHGGNLRAAAELYGTQEFLDFSANINPLGPPQGVFDAIARHTPAIIQYPDPSGHELKLRLSATLGVEPARLLLGNGAVELIYVLAQALRPRRCLLPLPTFSEYARALSAAGSELVYCYLRPDNGFALDPEMLEVEGCDLIVVCNPNNPTGTYLSETVFQQILQLARQQDAYLVVDASFVDFVEPALRWSIAKYLPSYAKLLVLYYLTKFYAIPGLRLGCGMGEPALLARLNECKDPWSVNSLALAAGVAALADLTYPAQTVQLIRQERDFLHAGLQLLPGLQVLPGTANFLLVHNAGPVWGNELVRALGLQGILVRECSNFPGLDGHYFRVAVRQHRDNLRLLAALAQVIPT